MAQRVLGRWSPIAPPPAPQPRGSTPRRVRGGVLERAPMKVRKRTIVGALLLCAGAAWALAALLRPAGPGGAAATAAGSSPDYPGGHPIDAALVSTGRLPLQVMPSEVTGALEAHSDEIVKTAELVERKQARITGTCAPGSAIRIVGADGTVVCQRFPRGVASVAAITAIPRNSTTGTAQGTVPGGVGRFQTTGADDFLVAPVQLPDGATVTGFSFVYFDADPRVDGAAYLYRSDDTVLAGIATQGSKGELQLSETTEVKEGRIDNSAYSYFVYFQVSAEASSNLIPITASVAYRTP